MPSLAGASPALFRPEIRAPSALFGYSPEEAIGRSFAILIPENRLDKEREIFERAAAGERVDRYATVSRSVDGRLIDTSWSIAPVNDLSGNVVGISLFARHVTKGNRSQILR